MDELDQKLLLIAVFVVTALFVLFIDLPVEYSRWIKAVSCIVVVIIIIGYKIKNVGKRK